MIRIFIRDKRWGEVEVVNGKLRVVDDDGTLEGDQFTTLTSRI
jgi:hypothetical protein